MTEETLLRLDKWLWYARFCKSRTLAAKLCASGRIHLDGAIVQKPHHQVRAGNVLTFPLGPHVRVIRILRLGSRRGPAPEARLLYEDLQPPDPSVPRGPSVAPRARGSGRPTKAERRAIDKLQNEKTGR
jgi:ribosome-associated heat shock protein Hsp15